jgi:hypothetical protein
MARFRNQRLHAGEVGLGSDITTPLTVEALAEVRPGEQIVEAFLFDSDTLRLISKPHRASQATATLGACVGSLILTFKSAIADPIMLATKQGIPHRLPPHALSSPYATYDPLPLHSCIRPFAAP